MLPSAMVPAASLIFAELTSALLFSAAGSRTTAVICESEIVAAACLKQKEFLFEFDKIEFVNFAKLNFLILQNSKILNSYYYLVGKLLPGVLPTLPTPPA